MSEKKLKVRYLRNILQSPFQIQRSENSVEEITTVQNALEELLPAAKLEKKVLSVQFKGNKKMKGKCEADIKEKPQNIYRTYLAPGFQSVVRGLEKNELCCVIVFSDIKPAFLQKVVFAYAQTSNVPVIVIPDLKTVTKSALGFATMALGFKRVVAESPENIFNPIYKLVSQSATTFETPFTATTKEDMITAHEVENNFVAGPSKPFESKTENLYLFRKRGCERVFIPRNKTKENRRTGLKSKKQKMNDFISLQEPPCETSTLSSNVTKKVVVENYSNMDQGDDNDDDNESGEGNFFFVDNKPDETLLKLKELQIVKNEHKSRPHIKKKKPDNVCYKTVSNNQVKSQKIKNKKGRNYELRKHNKIELCNTNKIKSTAAVPHVPENSNLPMTGKDYNTVSLVKKKQKQKVRFKRNPNNLNAVNFKPLNITAITSNSKKPRRRKKRAHI